MAPYPVAQRLTKTLLQQRPGRIRVRDERAAHEFGAVALIARTVPAMPLQFVTTQVRQCLQIHLLCGDALHGVRIYTHTHRSRSPYIHGAGQTVVEGHDSSRPYPPNTHVIASLVRVYSTDGADTPVE